MKLQRNIHFSGRFVIVICGIVFCTIVFVTYNYHKIAENSISTINNDKNKMKYILYWPSFTPFWWDDRWGYGKEPFKNCEYSNCYATDNMTAYIPVEDFDAILFHASNNNKTHGIPKVRSPHQVYIYVNLEAALISTGWNWNLESYASFYNWTMTFRYDSDLVNQYGYIFKEATDYSLPNADYFKNKSGAGWFVSHCDTHSKREVMAKELQKFYKIDVYGDCGNYSCPERRSEKCYKVIEKKYKFYLSFENSYCQDYTTEKLFNLLRRNVVPVVYGAANRNYVLPPQSVINVEDFKNVRELANYLKSLEDDTNKYAEYFEWKKNYVVRTRQNIIACKLCKRLHQPIKESVHKDLHNWWFNNSYAKCKTGKELPKIVSDLIK